MSKSVSEKDIAYSILDLALVPKGKTIKETFDHTVLLAQKAEEYGYHRIWYAEHHNTAAIASSSPPLLIGLVAQQTKSIRVGSGGIMLPNHSPLIVSEQFGTLGTLYPNRIDLGLGRAPGTDQETAHAIRAGFMQAAHSFPEDIEAIQTYFSDDNSRAKVRAPIAEGVEVPIYVLGSSTDSAHLAAKKGMPYAFASHFATTKLFQALDIYRKEFKPSDALQNPYSIAGVNVFVAETDEKAERMASSFLKMIIALLTGTRRDHLDEPSELSAELKEMWEHPQVKQMVQFSFIGSKETVKSQVREFLKQSKVQELIAVTNSHNQEDRRESYRLFSEIMKELNSEKQLSNGYAI